MADGQAAKTFAALTREQWNTYLANYVPVENQMISYATDPGTVANAVADARSNVADSFGVQQGVQARQMRGLGLTLTADEQRASDRQTALARSTADVDAANRAAARTTARQQSLLGNPAPTMQQPIV